MATSPPAGLRPALAPGALSLSLHDYQTSDREDSTRPASEVADDTPGVANRSSLAATLPTEVIQQILYLADPETFASLTLVNRSWREAAESVQVYAYQLARCPSFVAAADAPAERLKEVELAQLKRQLAQEVKRNLYAAFLRPRQTTLNLISTTTSSSAAFPYGEGFEFSFSHRARYCLAISSSRIIVLNTVAAIPHVVRELKVVRRPLSTCILADGSLLAVLAANHRVNLYDLTREHVMFRRSLELDETAHTITMTVHGEILAAGCEGGVEVVSLAETGPQTAKRVIKCDRVDHLAFSADGTMLLGTTQQSWSPSTVILTAPYFTDFSEHEMDHAELLSHLWTSQIIFPNSSRDCSHAALLPRTQDHDANWTLAYDRVFETFRAVRTDDLRNGTTYFTGPDPDQPSAEQQEREQRERNRYSKTSFTPRTLPAITSEGELVAAAFLTSDIWLYGVPEDLEHSGIKYQPTRASGNPSSVRSSLRDVDRPPLWQLLVDKYRNVFAKGRKVASVTGATNLSWCTTDSDLTDARKGHDRLVIAAPGGVSDSSDIPDAELASVDGGRLVFLDFHPGPQGGGVKELTIEVGSAKPELLEEENIDMDEEIAVVRRRTLARQEGASRHTISSVADVLRPVTIAAAPAVPAAPAAIGFGLDRSGTEESVSSQPDASVTEEGGDEVPIEEAIEDGPYSQSGPRSRGTVYRSAAAVEASRRRNPPTRQTQGPPEFRRTDGTEVPHDSDADNWVPPPPAYGQHVDDDKLSQEQRRSIASQNGSSTQRNAVSSSPSVRESFASLIAPPANLANRQSVVSQLSPGAANTTLSVVSPTSTTFPPVSPMSFGGSSLASRRPGSSSTQVRSNIEARRRNSADIEGTRWFSRHQDNRSASPALADEEPLQRSQSQRISPTATVQTSPRRPVSTYTPRSSLYRAALQPPPAIGTIDEPDSAKMRTPPLNPDRRSRDSTPEALAAPRFEARLERPLPSPPGPEQLAVVAERERSVSPMRSEDLARGPSSYPRIYEPPQSSLPPPGPSSGPSSEPSAWQANAIALAAAIPQSDSPLRRTGSKRKSDRILGITGFGDPPLQIRPHSYVPMQSTTSSGQPGPDAAGNSNAGVYSNANANDRAPPNTWQRTRRSIRFGRRPKTENPGVLVAAAPSSVPDAIEAALTMAGETVPRGTRLSLPPPPREPVESREYDRGHAQTQSLVIEHAQTSTGQRRGWELPPDSRLPITPIYEQSVDVQTPPALSGSRRVKMFSRIPPTGEREGAAPQQTLTAADALAGRRGEKKRGRGTKCVVM